MSPQFAPPANAVAVPPVLPEAHPGNRLFRHYRARPEGRNVFIYSDGTVSEREPDGQATFWKKTDATRVAQPYVTHAFWGGHSAEQITDAEAALLIAAGFTVTGVTVSGVIHMTGTGVLHAAGNKVNASSAAAALSGLGSMTVVGRSTRKAAAALHGTGSLSATSISPKTGVVHLTGTGSMTAAGVNVSPSSFVDPFTRANNTNISTSAPYPWTEYGDLTITSNQITSVSTSVEPRGRMEKDVGVNDMSAKATVKSLAFGGEVSFGVIGRFQTGSESGYLVVWDGTSASGTLYIYRLDSGGYTQLSSGVAQTAANNDIIEVRCVGSLISSYWNGVAVESVVDSTYTSGQRGGLQMYRDGTATISLDDFTIGTLASGDTGGGDPGSGTPGQPTNIMIAFGGADGPFWTLSDWTAWKARGWSGGGFPLNYADDVRDPGTTFVTRAHGAGSIAGQGVRWQTQDSGVVNPFGTDWGDTTKRATIASAFGAAAALAHTNGVDYFSGDWEPYYNKTWAASYSGHTNTALNRANAYLWGKAVGDAMYAAYPGLKIAVYSFRMPQGWDAAQALVNSGLSNAFEDEVQIDFFCGLMTAMKDAASGGRFIINDAIWYRDAAKYISGASESAAMKLHTQGPMAYFSRYITTTSGQATWDYVCNRIDVTAMSHRGSDSSAFYLATEPDDTEWVTQLALLRQWMMGPWRFEYIWENYGYPTLSSELYLTAADYLTSTSVNGAITAANSAAVDTSSPSITNVSAGAVSGGNVTITGRASHFYGIRCVQANVTPGGALKAAQMTFTPNGGSYTTNYNSAYMAWTITLPATSGNTVRITATSVKDTQAVQDVVVT